MKKRRVRKTVEPSRSVAHQLELIVFCFMTIAKAEPKPRNMDRINAVRAGMVAAFLAAGLLGLDIDRPERRR